LRGETAAAKHGAIDPQPIGEQRESAAVIQSSALKAQESADVTAEYNPTVCREAVALHVLADLQAVGEKGRAGVIAQDRPVTYQAASDVGTGQVDRAIFASASGGEPAEEHILADLQVFNVQGRAGVVAQDRPVTVEAGADASTAQADRACLTGTGDGEPIAKEHA
jgi:hypothetical protein